MSGSAELRALGLAGFVALVLLAAWRAFAGPVIYTSHVTVSATPAIVGNSIARGVLTIANPLDSSGEIDCGPWIDPPAQWYRLAIGDTVSWGILYKGQYTAETVFGCFAVGATVTAILSEEGGMPPATGTRTATATATPVPATATP